MAYTRTRSNFRSRTTPARAYSRTPSRSRRSSPRRASSSGVMRLVIEHTGAGVISRPETAINSYPFAPIARGNKRARR